MYMSQPTLFFICCLEFHHPQPGWPRAPFHAHPWEDIMTSKWYDVKYDIVHIMIYHICSSNLSQLCHMRWLRLITSFHYCTRMTGHWYNKFSPQVPMPPLPYTHTLIWFCIHMLMEPWLKSSIGVGDSFYTTHWKETNYMECIQKTH